jgi:hypothetical protein
MVQALAPFAPLFSRRVWHHAQVLLSWGLLRSSGHKDAQFRPARDGLGPGEALPPLPPGAQSCQVVESGGGSRPFGLARSGIRARRISLGRAHRRDVVQRRYGRKISARGVYRDPVPGHIVQQSRFLEAATKRYLAAIRKCARSRILQATAPPAQARRWPRLPTKQPAKRSKQTTVFLPNHKHGGTKVSCSALRQRSRPIGIDEVLAIVFDQRLIARKTQGLHSVAYPCGNTRCSATVVHSTGVRRLFEALQERGYARYCIWTSQNTPSGHFGE